MAATSIQHNRSIMATREELMKQLAAKGKGGTLAPSNITIGVPPVNPAYAQMGDLDPHDFDNREAAAWAEKTTEQVPIPKVAPDVYYVSPERRFVDTGTATKLTGGKRPKYSTKQVILIPDARVMATVDQRQVKAYNAHVASLLAAMPQQYSKEESIENVSHGKDDALSADDWAHKLFQAGVPEGTVFRFKDRIYKVKSPQDQTQEDSGELREDDPHDTDASDTVIF